MKDQQKKEIRDQIKILKSKISAKEKEYRSEEIFRKLENLDVFKDSRHIMFYWSMPDEVFTHHFIQKWAESKHIILPSVKGDKLELKTFAGVDDLVAGESFGIGEPSCEVLENSENVDLIIVPGVAFDKNNNRLGRGKAYYDKLLSATKAYKIGVCFDFQLLESVPTDIHDIKMDIIITDS